MIRHAIGSSSRDRTASIPCCANSVSAAAAAEMATSGSFSTTRRLTGSRERALPPAAAGEYPPTAPNTGSRADRSRPSGQKSSISSTDGSETSIVFDMRPETNAAPTSA